MAAVGIPLGILIGVISGFALLLLLRTAVRTAENDVKGILTIVGELLAIPTFWFGGPWVTTTMLSNVDLDEMLPSYVIALSAIFVLIAAFPLYLLIVRIGGDIARAEKATDG